MPECPRCKGDLDPASAGYSEHGLVCGPCHRELEARLARQAGEIPVASTETELANLGLFALGQAAGLPIPVRFVDDYLGERIQPSTHPEFFVYLRRGAQIAGPFHVRGLARLWTRGGVQATDEYRYPGMSDWKPVTEFVPPRP
jgi:hypothetical protein